MCLEECQMRLVSSCRNLCTSNARAPPATNLTHIKKQRGAIYNSYSPEKKEAQRFSLSHTPLSIFVGIFSLPATWPMAAQRFPTFNFIAPRRILISLEGVNILHLPLQLHLISLLKVMKKIWSLSLSLSAVQGGPQVSQMDR